MAVDLRFDKISENQDFLAKVSLLQILARRRLSIYHSRSDQWSLADLPTQLKLSIDEINLT